MKTAVRYYTRSGNTKKLAEAAASALSVRADDVSVPLLEKTDILFLCCSYYAFDIDEAVKRFIKENKDNIKKIVCIGSSAMMKSMKKPVRRASEGIPVADEEFHCRGAFGSIHKNRPDENDLLGVRDFVKGIIE